MKKIINSLLVVSMMGASSVFALYYPESFMEDLEIRGSVGFESEYVYRGSKLAQGSMMQSVEASYPAFCGKAYAGILVSEQEADAEMAGKPMIMHAASCDDHEIQIPFHIAEGQDTWDRSRTWIITRTDHGLRLKHRHRHEDGSLDDVTNYGGDTNSRGTAERQEFPVDAESIASFKANGLDQSVTNVWAVDLSDPGQGDAKFAYELRRPESAGGRYFRVEFDLSKPVAPPPSPWGD